jgi:hypothetical protein
MINQTLPAILTSSREILNQMIQPWINDKKYQTCR